MGRAAGLAGRDGGGAGGGAVDVGGGRASSCAGVAARLRSITSPLIRVDSATGQMMPALAPWADVLFASDAKWWRQLRDEGEGVCGIEDHGQQRPALAGGEAACSSRRGRRSMSARRTS